MPDVEALAQTIRAALHILDAQANAGIGSRRSQTHVAASAALDGLVEAAGKAEAGRASAAPTPPVGEAGAGAEDRREMFKRAEMRWMSVEDSEITVPSRDLALVGRELAALVEAVRQRDEVRDALQRLADVTGNYLLWAPREKGHAAAHTRLWDAYREYEAAVPLPLSPVPEDTPR